MKFEGAILLFVVLANWSTGTGSHPANGVWLSGSYEGIDETFDIVYPERLDKGRARRDLSTRSTNAQDEDVSFRLKAFGRERVVDIQLNKILATPQFTLRYFKDDGKLIQRQEAAPECQYQGHVKGQEAESTVILDTCHGLNGLIEDKEDRMYIEPYPAKGKGAHKIYKTKDGKWKEFSCGTIPGGNTSVRGYHNVPKSQRRKREAEETEYKKYLTTEKTRYTELMIIVDNVVYKKYKQDINDVKRRVFTLVNAVDAIYRKINIRVVLSALEIWTDRDHVPFVKRAGEDLRNFENHDSSNLAGVIYDSIHLLRGKMWDDYGGMAYKGEICKRRSLGVDAWNYWGSLGPWLALSHELGHNFNFDHDNIWPTCKCLSPRGCVMGSYKTRVPGFSDCNLHNMSSIVDSCLFNLPKKVVNPRCGNGIPEPGEECDCGTPEECQIRDPCCEPNDCRLKESSQCSDSLQRCCQQCQIAPLGTICRNSTGECDVQEACNGRSAQCPPDDYVKDGTPCAEEGELLVGKYLEGVKVITLPKPITARHVRINPQYWERGLCAKIDLLGCGAGSSASLSDPNPIQGFGNLCVRPQGQSSSCPSVDGTQLIYGRRMQGGCQGEASKFTLSNGILRQHCSGKMICPQGGQGSYGVPLVISNSCAAAQSKFERTAGKSLRHVSSGFCVHPAGGVASEGVKLVLWAGCDQERLAFHFLVHDCLVSLGVSDSQVIPAGRISASSHLTGFPAKEARLHGGKGWCAARKDKNQFIQIDLGQVRRLSAIVQSGTDRGDVTGYVLQYTQDGRRWKVWSSKPPAPAFCYKGRCAISADSQCRDLWGPEASSAATACYQELNVNSQGFGSCSSRIGVPRSRCAKRHAKCGQLQCYTAARERPVVDYGSFYKLKVLPSGEKCRAVSRKRDHGNKLVGMVKEGTVCGNNKICVANQCTCVNELPSNRCPRTNDGQECAGRGVCTRKGVCHCQGNLDPETACQSEKQPRDGRWGAWSKWANCTRVCGRGKRTRQRFCNNPAPAHGGRDCVGKRIQVVPCNTGKCPDVHSCQHLLSLGKETGVQFPNGVYTINPDQKGPVKTFCDMTRDGGGWTLLVTSHTNTWTTDNVRKRNQNQPSLNGDFSILYKGDYIKDSLNVEGEWFEYRIEANERGHWGGIWRAPRDYTFMATNNQQTSVDLVRRFDNWKYDDYGIEKRMPWISGAKLTTSRNATGDRQWGTLIANSKIFYPAPWLDGNDLEQHPVNIWYWVREQNFKLPKSCLEVQLRGVQNKPVQDGTYTIKPGDRKIQTFCKFSEYGGGWTLILTSASDDRWTRDNVNLRNVNSPSLSSDFSILQMAENITNMKHFQYRIEEDSVETWEGIWTAKAGCSFVSGRSNTPCVKLVHKRGDCNSLKAEATKTLPYLTTYGKAAILTGAVDESSVNGAIVVDSTKGVNRQRTEVIRLWLREGTWRSCNEIKMKNGERGGAMKDGIYMIRKTSHDYLPVYCDMTSEVGAYTLLVTSASNGWTKDEAKFKNLMRPSLTKDYSILGLADQIKDLSGGNTFKYRLEANTRGNWGGVWTAPSNYSFVSENNQQTDVTLVKRFSQWQYSWRDSLEKRMPWLGARQSLLTTSTHSDYSDWGSIISETKSNNPAPWIYSGMPNPGVIWYWVNEDDCGQKRTPVNGGLSEWSSWSSCSKICATGIQTRRRLCNNPRPRCGGDACGSTTTKQEKQCLVCPTSPIRAHGGFCLQPKNGGCSPADNTRLVYIRDTSQCSKDYMVFTYHDDVLTHKCSGKRVCPQGRTTTWQTPLVISSTCTKDGSKFKRTLHRTLQHKVSGFCVHPTSGTPQYGTTAIMWMDECKEERLRLDLFKLPVYQSPIRAANGFCVQPASASCNPVDGTRLVYHKASRCDRNYMYFTYKDDVLMHTCSGKKVCPQGGTATWETPLVISSTCSTDESKFQRTSYKTLIHKASGFCVHPYGGPPKEGVKAIMWKDNCNEDRLQLDLYMLRGPG